MKKSLKYILGALVALIIIFLSLDIQKLDEHNATETTKEFNAEEYARDVWKNRFPLAMEEAMDIVPLIKMLSSNPGNVFENYGRKLGISTTWYFMIKGEGDILSTEDEFITVQINDSIQVELETAFIFGNAVRDGSGVVDINDFVNMTDFNNVSVILNKLVKEEVVADLKRSGRPGMNIKFYGAFEINEKNIDISSIRIIPVSVSFSDEK